MRAGEFYDVNEAGFAVGSITTSDATLDDERKAELDEKESRRIQPGFAPSKRKRMKGGGRRPGSWPKVGWLS